MMVRLCLATLAGLGTHWLYTAIAFGWHGLGAGPKSERRTRPRDRGSWLRQAGLAGVSIAEVSTVVVVLAVVGFGIGHVLFAATVPAMIIAGFAASVPVAAIRRRRRERLERALDAWPRMIEELRLQVASLGRSIPQALFEVGARGPDAVRAPFAAARREWALSTDFERTIDVLKHGLADPTADMVGETLLVAHELGGADLDHRLGALAEDRATDAQHRKDARSRLAGARFARIFVLIVPAGMALVGASVGNGRSAYRTTVGQIVVAAALAMVAICWLWAGRVMRLPDADRVFAG